MDLVGTLFTILAAIVCFVVWLLPIVLMRGDWCVPV